MSSEKQMYSAVLILGKSLPHVEDAGLSSATTSYSLDTSAVCSNPSQNSMKCYIYILFFINYAILVFRRQSEKF